MTTQHRVVEHELGEGMRLRVEAVMDGVLRVRIALGDSFSGSALNRYGFLSEGEASAVLPVDAVEPDAQAGVLTLGGLVKQSGFALGDPTAEARLAVEEDEDWIGFGDQARDRLFHRGHVVDCWVKNVQSYIVSPFFISTRGYAVLVNSTHRVSFDMAAADPETVSWRDSSGRLDYYLFLGGDFLGNIRLYTALTGRPSLPPEWAFGLWYICREQANDYEAVNDALNFRREGIPCDVIGLEPGWMETKYDAGTDKKWHPERFPIPKWCPNGPHNFIDAIRRMGFHFELWECNDYDLSYEEERRIGRKSAEACSEDGSAAFHKGAEVDEHFTWPRRLDKVTKIDEPWFEHHKKFVDQGTDFFKQDGSFQVCEHPDRVFGNGMLDAEMHNLYPLLYSRQMNEGLREHTGRRPVVFTVAGWTGFQAWCGTWTGDTGGRIETLGSMLNTSVLGHCWTTNDMEVMQPEGIHFGYLQPWSQINSWTYFRMPWVQGEQLLQMHRHYSRLRSRLIPYVYSVARACCREGIPLLMPLPLAFEQDPVCRETMHQYLLGPSLMVVAYEPDAYFPEGRWKDYWTGKIIEGGARRTVKWPATRGGGLFVREGALIPFGPVMQFRREHAMVELELYAFPGDEPSDFALYEDDGVSFEHEHGIFAETHISCSCSRNVMEIRIGTPTGPYTDLPAERTWTVVAALDQEPATVTVNGLDVSGWAWDSDRGELRIPDCGSPCEVRIALRAPLGRLRAARL